jgi:transcriptional regulator with XRE-family HTH domain
MNKNTQPTSLGAYLRQRRQSLGLSTQEVANRSGINRAQVVRIENGTSAQPGADTLKGLAAALDLDLSDIWAMAGYREAADLPTPMLYLRAKYRDLPESDLAALSRDVARILADHGLGGNGEPAPGEDELDDDAFTASSHSKGGTS